ncbi:hypothetical protein E1B28_002034 [Marasmius oreades]|uniref:Uncharacterized protein n=1 Tax=Marasmius oreades TaxID=181124 RepID=A0A9P7V4T3_9AGAR|nr:uncharacterized protein E1B28_002034 [Marasmius oreades]KAG7100261.1 hypothetical protein E1B28_002034 [Marasmius oreades]
MMFAFTADSLSLFSFLLVCLEVATSASPTQSTSLPSTTPGKSDERPYEERVSLARAALDVGVNGGSTDASGTLAVGDIYETTPLLFSQLAEFDIITHNTTYRDLLKVQIPRATAEIVSSSYFVRFFLTIQDPRADDLAICLLITVIRLYLWDFGRAHCISDDDIRSKRIATKSLSLRSTCDGKTLVGGVFTTPDPKDGELEAASTSAFLILSTLLAEVTSNATYIEAATQTLQFLRNFAYFPSSDGVDDQRMIFALDDSDHPCHSNLLPHWYPITGDLIEGLSILGSIQNDTPTESLLQQTVNSSTLQRQGQRPDGILDNEVKETHYPTGDPYLVRGLATAYRRKRIDSGMTDYIKGFLNVQYEALLSNARLPGNLYGGSWIGPPDRKFSFRNQTYGAMVLVQAISLANDISSGGNYTSSNLPRPPKSTHPNKIGAIIGGVVGGVSFVAILLGVVVLLIRRRRRRNREGQEPSMSLPSPSISESSENGNGIEDGIENDSTSPISQSALRVKSRSNSIQEPTATAEGDPSRDVPLNEDTQVRYQDMSTAEMSQILNTRLRIESFNAEMPPAYE